MSQKQINSVELQGFLGADPDCRYTASGTSVCKFRLATTDRRKNRDGEWENGDTHWHNITCFGQMAEWAGNNLRKGKCVNAQGKITYREYKEKWYTDIIAFKVRVVDKDDKPGPVDDDIPF